MPFKTVEHAGAASKLGLHQFKADSPYDRRRGEQERDAVLVVRDPKLTCKLILVTGQFDQSKVQADRGMRSGLHSDVLSSSRTYEETRPGLAVIDVNEHRFGKVGLMSEHICRSNRIISTQELLTMAFPLASFLFVYLNQLGFMIKREVYQFGVSEVGFEMKSVILRPECFGGKGRVNLAPKFDQSLENSV